jgi:RNA polymerase sigma-70 factor (ECF subfamily)
MPPDLGQLYDEHAPALFAFLLNVTRNEADARDVLQEVFLKLARQPQRMDGVREVRAWLLRMAHRLAIDAVRRRASHDRAVERAAAEPAELFAPADEAGEQAFRDAVALALRELPEEQRAVVHLKLWEDMTFAEIAGTLGVSANTAASRYRYALDKLGDLLRPLHDEHP